MNQKQWQWQWQWLLFGRKAWAVIFHTRNFGFSINHTHTHKKEKKNTKQRKKREKNSLMFRALLEELHREVFTEGVLQIFDYNN